jgi:hypothetical protein
MTDRRNDAGLAPPMVEDIVRRYERAPEELLVDTGYATADDIIGLSVHAAGPIKVFAPPPKERENSKPASRARRRNKLAKEPAALKEWRERMASAAGKAIYAMRKRIERVNAERKNHGFGFTPVRGLVKTKAVALWHALAHNAVAAARLRATLA